MRVLTFLFKPLRPLCRLPITSWPGFLPFLRFIIPDWFWHGYSSKTKVTYFLIMGTCPKSLQQSNGRDALLNWVGARVAHRSSLPGFGFTRWVSRSPRSKKAAPEYSRAASEATTQRPG